MLRSGFGEIAKTWGMGQKKLAILQGGDYNVQEQRWEECPVKELAQIASAIRPSSTMAMDALAKQMKADRVLELNADSAPFAALKKAVEAGDKDTVAKYAKLLYAQALLLAGLPLEDPAEYSQLVCSLMI